MPVASLPHGDQRKLEVALLMALEPQVYMFDEPTAGMSHDEAPVILNLIRALKPDKTKIILLVEHKMDVVRELADRIIVLHQRHAGGRWRAGRSDCLAGGAGGLSGHEQEGGRRMSKRRPAGAHANLLTLEGVHTHIGAYHILHGVDLRRAAGQLTMLLGRNGAGKTTTLRTIMGLWQASRAHALQRPGHHALHTPQIAGWASPTCPKTWASLPT
jgi:ABC-type branched-subunit amino acid transport system ATPase component